MNNISLSKSLFLGHPLNKSGLVRGRKINLVCSLPHCKSFFQDALWFCGCLLSVPGKLGTNVAEILNKCILYWNKCWCLHTRDKSAHAQLMVSNGWAEPTLSIGGVGCNWVVVHPELFSRINLRIFRRILGIVCWQLWFCICPTFGPWGPHIPPACDGCGAGTWTGPMLGLLQHQ